MSQFAPVFDWYQGTFPEGARLGARDVLGMLADEPLQALPGRYGYSRGWDVRRDGSTLCRLYEGHGLRDHFVATGADSPEVAAAVRNRVPGHFVSRADVALDFVAGPDFFATTRELLHSRLAGSVVLTDYVETAPAGTSSTLYVGSKKAEVRMRVYEKGKQDPETYAPDTVRMEVQVRPGKPDRKAYAAGLDPLAFYGMARWSREALQAVTGLHAPAAPVRSARVSDLDRALDTMACQYGGRILELLERLDGDLAAGMADLVGRIPGLSDPSGMV